MSDRPRPDLVSVANLMNHDHDLSESESMSTAQSSHLQNTANAKFSVASRKRRKDYGLQTFASEHYAMHYMGEDISLVLVRRTRHKTCCAFTQCVLTHGASLLDIYERGHL